MTTPETARAPLTEGAELAAPCPPAVEGTAPDEFVLDQAANPHPAMLANARLAKAHRGASPTAETFWQGVLCAMSWATGETTEAIDRWVGDVAPPAPTANLGTPVHFRGRRP